MAYVANKPGEDQYKSESQNIQKQGQQQQQSGSNLATSAAPQTSANGQQQQGTPSGSQPNAAPGSFTKSNFTNASQILDRNQNADTSAITGRLLGNTQQEADAEKANYGKTADAYRTDQTKGIDNKYGNLDIGQINKGLGGDADAYKAVQQTYSRQAADPLAALNLQKYGDLTPKEFYQNGNYQPLLQQRSQGNYTAGMGALDAAVLNKSNAGQQIRDQVAGLQNGVNDAYKKAAGTQADVQNYANTKQAQQRTNLGNTLSGLEQGINTDISSRLPAAQQAQAAQAQAARAGQVSGLSAKTQAALQSLLANQEQASKYGEGDIVQGDIDKLKGFNDSTYNPYVNVNTPELNAGNITTQADADRYKKIADVLGDGKYLQAGSAAAPTATADSGGFQQFLDSISNSPDRQRMNELVAGKQAQEKQKAFNDALAAGNGQKALEAANQGNGGVAGDVQNNAPIARAPTTQSAFQDLLQNLNPVNKIKSLFGK